VFKKILFTLLAFFTLLVAPFAFAEEASAPSGQGFATSYNVTFDINEEGVTAVTEKITLKNLTSQYYANQFKLTIGATEITDVKASDAAGAMETQVEKQANTTVITVKFNQQVAGLNKELPWTLSFKSKDFAEKQGKVWEIRAPKISSSTNLESYNMTIAVPVSFGEPSLISPTPKSESTSFNKRFLTYEKDQLINSGVSASFGDYQLFDFDLSYHLENSKVVPIITNIALPPDTAYQDVIYQRVDPKPLNITVDEDGNYLAWFRLTRGEKMDIKVVGSAKLYTGSKVKNPKLPQSLIEKYTSNQKYWEKDNPVIKNTLAEVLGNNPPTSNREKANLIYRYVVGTLKYDPGRINDQIQRYGAVTALKNIENAVCMEFTDLFIALARAANIPTRELDGYAHTTNEKLRPRSLSETGSAGSKDILHSWPEYWDEEKGWVMVDPTWENTTGGVDYFNKLDLNHFAFVVKGLSSEYPVPAGAYKYVGKESQDVKVTLSEKDFLVKPQLNVEIITPDQLMAGIPQQIKVKISNEGNGVFPSTSLVIDGERLEFNDVKKLKTGPIPAFGNAEFEYVVKSKGVLDTLEDQITVSIGNDKFTKNVKVAPFILIRSVPALLGLILLLMASVYFTVLGLFIYRKKFAKKTKKS